MKNIKTKILLYLTGIFVFILILCSIFFYHLIRSDIYETKNNLKCHNNLLEIQRCLSFYRDKYKSLPPPIIYDNNGKPMHSWRVLLLPFLGEDDLYKKYRFDEPWNGPNNSLLVKEIPEYYRCPIDNSPPYNTSYLAITSPNKHKTTSFSNKLRDTDGRLWVVEVKNSGINWMEPKDLDIDTLSEKSDSPTPYPSSNHINGIYAISGINIEFLPKSITREEFVFDCTLGYKESWTEKEKKVLHDYEKDKK